jgi:hypothetical protein
LWRASHPVGHRSRRILAEGERGPLGVGDIPQERFPRPGLTFGAAFGMVIDYQDQGKIPPASIIVRSGRGLWLMWLLRDPRNPDRAQPAFAEKIDLYLRVERAMARLMAELAADAAATCAARYIRLRQATPLTRSLLVYFQSGAYTPSTQDAKMEILGCLLPFVTLGRTSSLFCKNFRRTF